MRYRHSNRRPWLLASSQGLWFALAWSRYIWWPQHILSHHQYTNDDALDVDLHHLRPARLHPGCEVREMQGDRRYGMGRSGWVRGCMVGLMARCHDPVQVDEGYGGANFIF